MARTQISRRRASTQSHTYVVRMGDDGYLHTKGPDATVVDRVNLATFFGNNHDALTRALAAAKVYGGTVEHYKFKAGNVVRRTIGGQQTWQVVAVGVNSDGVRRVNPPAGMLLQAHNGQNYWTEQLDQFEIVNPQGAVPRAARRQRAG